MTEASSRPPHAKRPIQPRFLQPMEFVEKWGGPVRSCFPYCEMDYSHRLQGVCVHDMRVPEAIREVLAFKNAEIKTHNFTEKEVLGRVEKILSMAPATPARSASSGSL
jgi:hypothetical protein